MNDNKEFKKALCWQLSTDGRGGIIGHRIAVASRYVLMQEMPVGNERPRWHIEGCIDERVATERAISVTKYLEDTMGAKLIVEPTEVILHDAEVLALRDQGPIPPSLRARVFTSLQRKRQGADGPRSETI